MDNRLSLAIEGEVGEWRRIDEDPALVAAAPAAAAVPTGMAGESQARSVAQCRH